jgi:hypothetical protein
MTVMQNRWQGINREATGGSYREEAAEGIEAGRGMQVQGSGWGSCRDHDEDRGTENLPGQHALR